MKKAYRTASAAGRRGVIVKESAKTLLLNAIRVGDEHNPPVKPRGHHLDNGLLVGAMSMRLIMQQTVSRRTG